jgi:2-keto-4-pentenoate hydratase
MSDLATALWNARLAGNVIDPDAFPVPATMDEAYAVQARVTALAGDTMLGFKIGSTSSEAQKLLGTDRPGSGPLLARFCHDSPARVTLAAAQMPAVEGEFAYRFGKDLAPRVEPYSREEVLAAVSAVAGAVEIVGSRYAGGLAGKGRFRITADGGANIAFVAGRWHTTTPARDVRQHAVAMRINGKLHGHGTGSRALGDPLDVLVWLAHQQQKTDRGVRAGDIVTTGTCTGVDRVMPGDRITSDFGDLGTVEIQFE